LATVLGLFDKKLYTLKAFKSNLVSKKEFIQSWLKLLIIITVLILSILKENENSLKEQKSLKAKILEAANQKTRDSLNAVIYNDSLAMFANKNADSLKQFSSRNSDSLKSYSSNIIKLLAKYNLKYDTTTNNIFKRIDTTKNKQEPFITYSPSDSKPFTHKQIHDTLFFYPTICNSGHSPAFDVNIKAYYLFVLDKYTLEYKKPIFEFIHTEISDNPISNMLELAENNSYIPDFKFDSANKRQFILLLGTYKNQLGEVKTLELCYNWVNGKNIWGTNDGIKDKVKSAHFDAKRLKYF
jgi:hypothetical protein